MSYPYRHMVDELCDITDGLTNWECDFVSDMKDWEGEYTEKQKAVIQRIYDKMMEWRPE